MLWGSAICWLSDKYSFHCDDSFYVLYIYKKKNRSSQWKWHLRFGHLHFSGLKLISSAGMVHGLPVIKPPSNVCEGCILGKQARLSFPNGKSWRATSPLQLVHTDICGPIDPMSLGGNRYFRFIFLKKNQLSLLYSRTLKLLLKIKVVISL
jgi:hypothetical protein